MTLTVETGTGVLGADSLASVDDADAYWGARGTLGQPWIALPNTAKEAALRDASDYASMRLSTNGALTGSQSFNWPWADFEVYPRDRMTIVKAVVIAADVARLGPLTGGAARSDRVVVSESKTLGPLSKSTTYGDHPVPSSANGRDLSFVDDLLASLGRSSGSGLVIGRSVRA